MNFATTKQRIIQYIENKGITVREFLEKTEIKRGFLDSDKLESIVSDIFITKIIAKYPDINLEWLLTGNGEMLRETFTLKPTTYLHDNVEEETNNKDYLIDVQKKLIEKLEKEVKELKEQLEQALKEKA